MKSPFLQLFRLAVAMLAGALALNPARADELHAHGPLALIITYQASPANRAALRQELSSAGVRQFQRWKQDGVLASYTLLFGRYADSANPDAAALLSFPNYAALQRWKMIEQHNPAGLSSKALALIRAIQTVPADLVRGKQDQPASADSVFMVIPYQTMIPAPDYLKYADGYVVPQFEGWIKEGVLARYAIYADRYAAGRPWSTMVILEYKNDAALGSREAVVARVRARLSENPEWKAISDSKKAIRSEQQLLIADPLIAH
jgi:hypothetical protein